MVRRINAVPVRQMGMMRVFRDTAGLASGVPVAPFAGADTKLLRPSASLSKTLFKDVCLYFLALATDYDGTLARDGGVDAATLEALERFKATGRRLILVTGRELPHIKEPFPQLKMFDRCGSNSHFENLSWRL
jgi:haloacid dehalogenase-like hydrolase